ncbi:hypothetical protein [Geopsychrobacter electrodiphilus]|uniref:hypothetical protein n=1 Tax=Geopsychrobacter electrodiphilus TaxID=225196 RepID=UPI00035F50F4|nr:hypothetical protein [Geopsychrobacter electrodiphilus]
MASKTHLQLFAQQLASWAEQIIENGRTPFRRVDLFHQLRTEAGSCQPPLIFWINRQSMIAGGLIFLPEMNNDKLFIREAAAAASLGLRNFVTWESETINIWEASPTENRRISSLPLPGANDPAIFHHRLYEIIDQLKLLSVTGRIAAQEVSPCYLLNLIDETLKLSQPALLEHCRLQRSEQASVLTAEEEAENWNRLSLLRLLCLQHWQQLPKHLPVEHFSLTLAEALTQLPSPLRESLLTLTPLPDKELPTESVVAFHHLMLRIQQIGWNQGKGAKGVLTLLLRDWYPDATGDPLNKVNRLLFHSQELAPRCQSEISHSGAQLAANTLWRTLQGHEHPVQKQGDAFIFSLPFEDQRLHANFYGTIRPEPALRRELSGYLRSSWPNRKLTIPGNLPFWATEATHILGLTVPNSEIELHLPDNWLTLLRYSFFTELLFANFAINSVECHDHGRHLLKLARRPNEGLTECKMLDGSQRSLDLGQEPELACSRLLYALELSPFLFELFCSQQLKSLDIESEELNEIAALICFSKSSLGQMLWFTQTGIAPPAVEPLFVTEALRFGWLIPDLLHLQELKRLTKDQPSTANLDVLVAQLLDIPHDEKFANNRQPQQNESPSKPANNALGEDLLRQLEIEGIPQFPQTYLYRLATGPLQSYRFTPPLYLKHEMLGLYELEDAQGKRFQVTGEETKDALLLAGNLMLTTLEIPQDRQQTAAMIDNYRQDLLQLQEKMTRLCHRHIAQLPAAQRLQKKLWQQLSLPPLKWLSS